ncbi:MAG: osmoprotectant transport system substrate-binding protein [Pseudonocardiales bacterium]|jgi:osmoprotectant transport system substrate-binding protein|nr:osmoprotectant transport system substrate-binding protein [Pseudonocardiales bacterium]
MRNKFAVGLATLATVAVAITACSSSKPNNAGSGGSSSSSGGASAGSITIGSAGFSESELLADIYGDALSAKGVTVTKKLNIGERPVYFKALQDGSIDFFPEYSGSILAYLDPKATAKSPADVAAALPAALGSKLTALKYAAAQDSDTITVTKNTATKYNLSSIGDLASVANKLTLGAPAQFKTRADGVPALKSVYGVVFKDFTVTAAGGTVTVNSLKNGSIDAADIFSTDPSIQANNFVSLKDPKSMFAAQNIVPIVSTSKLNPTITDAANAVSAKLDTATLASLVSKIQVDGKKADDVAKEWLSSVGLG